MKAQRLFRPGLVLFVFALLVGCGKGLTVSVTSSPSPAVPGAPYDLTVQVRNDTQCATADDVEIPAFTNAPPLALVLAFVPDLGMEAAAFCRSLQVCQDVDCLNDLASRGFNPALLGQVREATTGFVSGGANAAALSGAGIGTCEELDNDDELGVFGICAFDPIGPGETRSLMLSGITPDTGNLVGAQLAFVIAGARGANCAPGIEVGDGEWQLGGCFPLTEANAVPAFSRGGMAMLLAALLVAASLGLRRSRRH